MVLLDLYSDTEPYLALADQLRRRRPTVHIIACSPWKTPDPELLLKAMRTGVQEFLPKPVQPGALKAILERFRQEHETGQAEDGTKVIVVMGAKGGVGTSVRAGEKLGQERRESGGPWRSKNRPPEICLRKRSQEERFLGYRRDVHSGAICTRSARGLC